VGADDQKVGPDAEANPATDDVILEMAALSECRILYELSLTTNEALGSSSEVTEK
jgi:hypothetical protein